MVRGLVSALVMVGASAGGLTARAAPPIEAYGKLPAMEDVRLSPSGDRYAFVADDGHARRLYVITADNKPLTAATIGTQKLVGLEWAGEDLLVLYLSATVKLGLGYVLDQQELSGAVILNVKTGVQTAIFSNKSFVAPSIHGAYGMARISGRWFGYYGGETLEAVAGSNGDRVYKNTDRVGDIEYVNDDLYQVDLETGAPRLAAKGERGSAGWLIGPGGEVVARALHDEHTGTWEIRTGAWGGKLLASGASKLSGVSLLGLGRDGDSVVFSHEGAEGSVVEEAPLAGGPVKTVLDGESTDSLIQDGATGRWIGTVQDGDVPSYTLFSALAAARVRGTLKAFPGYIVHLKSWSDDFGRLIVFTDGKDDPGTWWLVDIAEKSAVPIGYARRDIADADVGAVTMIDWKAADGLALHGVLTLPPGRVAKNLPVVVMPHGGPWVRDYPGFDYWAQAFASRGYAVFQPNFRGSSGYGAALREAGRGEWGGKMQTDISDGLAALGRQGIVDPHRAAIVGWSYGGYAALAGVTVQHGLYRCAVSMAGVSDISGMFTYLGEEAGTDSDATRFWKAYLGDGSRWRQISPARLAGQADAPILLIHGKDDTVVPIAQSDTMERALAAAGKPVERLTMAGADHWLLREDTRVAMLNASVAFVEKYNPPDVMPPAR